MIDQEQLINKSNNRIIVAGQIHHTNQILQQMLSAQNKEDKSKQSPFVIAKIKQNQNLHQQTFSQIKNTQDLLTSPPSFLYSKKNNFKQGKFVANTTQNKSVVNNKIKILDNLRQQVQMLEDKSFAAAAAAGNTNQSSSPQQDIIQVSKKGKKSKDQINSIKELNQKKQNGMPKTSTQSTIISNNIKMLSKDEQKAMQQQELINKFRKLKYSNSKTLENIEFNINSKQIQSWAHHQQSLLQLSNQQKMLQNIPQSKNSAETSSVDIMLKDSEQQNVMSGLGLASYLPGDHQNKDAVLFNSRYSPDQSLTVLDKDQGEKIMSKFQIQTPTQQAEKEPLQKKVPVAKKESRTKVFQQSKASKNLVTSQQQQHSTVSLSPFNAAQKDTHASKNNIFIEQQQQQHVDLDLQQYTSQANVMMNNRYQIEQQSVNLDKQVMEIIERNPIIEIDNSVQQQLTTQQDSSPLSNYYNNSDDQPVQKLLNVSDQAMQNAQPVNKSMVKNTSNFQISEKLSEKTVTHKSQDTANSMLMYQNQIIQDYIGLTKEEHQGLLDQLKLKNEQMTVYDNDHQNQFNTNVKYQNNKKSQNKENSGVISSKKIERFITQQQIENRKQMQQSQSNITQQQQQPQYSNTSNSPQVSQMQYLQAQHTYQQMTSPSPHQGSNQIMIEQDKRNNVNMTQIKPYVINSPFTSKSINNMQQLLQQQNQQELIQMSQDQIRQYQQQVNGQNLPQKQSPASRNVKDLHSNTMVQSQQFQTPGPTGGSSKVRGGGYNPVYLSKLQQINQLTNYKNRNNFNSPDIVTSSYPLIMLKEKYKNQNQQNAQQTSQKLKNQQQNKLEPVQGPMNQQHIDEKQITAHSSSVHDDHHFFLSSKPTLPSNPTKDSSMNPQAKQLLTKSLNITKLNQNQFGGYKKQNLDIITNQSPLQQSQINNTLGQKQGAQTTKNQSINVTNQQTQQSQGVVPNANKQYIAAKLNEKIQKSIEKNKEIEKKTVQSLTISQGEDSNRYKQELLNVIQTTGKSEDYDQQSFEEPQHQQYVQIENHKNDIKLPQLGKTGQIKHQKEFQLSQDKQKVMMSKKGQDYEVQNKFQRTTQKVHAQSFDKNQHLHESSQKLGDLLNNQQRVDQHLEGINDVTDFIKQCQETKLIQDQMLSHVASGSNLPSQFGGTSQNLNSPVLGFIKQRKQQIRQQLMDSQNFGLNEFISSRKLDVNTNKNLYNIAVQNIKQSEKYLKSYQYGAKNQMKYTQKFQKSSNEYTTLSDHKKNTIEVAPLKQDEIQDQFQLDIEMNTSDSQKSLEIKRNLIQHGLSSYNKKFHIKLNQKMINKKLNNRSYIKNYKSHNSGKTSTNPELNNHQPNPDLQDIIKNDQNFVISQIRQKPSQKILVANLPIIQVEREFNNTNNSRLMREHHNKNAAANMNHKQQSFKHLQGQNINTQSELNENQSRGSLLNKSPLSFNSKVNQMIESRERLNESEIQIKNRSKLKVSSHMKNRHENMTAQYYNKNYDNNHNRVNLNQSQQSNPFQPQQTHLVVKNKRDGHNKNGSFGEHILRKSQVDSIKNNRGSQLLLMKTMDSQCSSGNANSPSKLSNRSNPVSDRAYHIKVRDHQQKQVVAGKLVTQPNNKAGNGDELHLSGWEN